jgi:hypothetical protein
MADDTNFEPQLAAAYAKAPKVVQDYISSGELEKFLGRIRGQYRFSTEQMAPIGAEILMALLGITTLADVRIGIKVGTDIPTAVRSQLLDDIQASVFEPLEKKLPPAPVVKKEVATAPSVPLKPVPPPAPINRLAQAATPKLLPKHEDAKPVPPPVVQKAAPSAPVTPPVLTKMPTAPVIKPVAPPIKSTSPQPQPAARIEPKPVLVPPVSAPKPPLVAPVPQSVAPKAPSAPVPPKSTEPVKRIDPYREPIE